MRRRKVVQLYRMYIAKQKRGCPGAREKKQLLLEAMDRKERP